MAPELDPHRMRELLKKNLATSFGLTLVVGLPLAPPILAQLARVRAAVEAQLPGQYQWYASKHLHATVMPLLRGRYREAPPLQLHELPADLNSLADRLDDCFSALQPFRFAVDRLEFMPDGRLLALGADPGHVRRQVAERLASLARLDPPKDLGDWHVTVGYLATPSPFASEAERAGFEAGLARLQAGSPSAMEVHQVWLVHYADRTLDRIVGRIPLPVGSPIGLTSDYILTRLAIGPH
jgi:hypothetical protein